MAIVEERQAGKDAINLSGPDGNAFALMGFASKYAKRLDLDEDKIIEEMQQGDYEHLIETFDRYFGDYIDLIR